MSKVNEILSRMSQLPPELQEEIIKKTRLHTRHSFCNTDKKMREFCKKYNILDSETFLVIKKLRKNYNKEQTKNKYIGKVIFLMDQALELQDMISKKLKKKMSLKETHEYITVLWPSIIKGFKWDSKRTGPRYTRSEL